MLIADHEYYLVHCWTCICNAFSCASFIFPVDHPLFFLPKIVQKICLSENFVIVTLLTHQSYYTSCFLFLLSGIAVLLLTSDLFSCRNFLVPSNFDLKWNESLLRKPGETQKLLNIVVTTLIYFSHYLVTLIIFLVTIQLFLRTKAKRKHDECYFCLHRL